MVYACGLCVHLYDEEQEGVPWAQLPADWSCPVCGSAKSEFSPKRQPKPQAPAAPAPAAPSNDVHELSVADLCTTNSEISQHTTIEHV